MSSGDNAKPPATFEERNPFDISRRSGTDVAAEIAKRMVAWKQARARTSATSTTVASGETRPSSGDAKSPPIAAPVQPARMPPAPAPNPAPTATPAARSTATSMPRVPYFASSAARRAMPPAPSLKQGSARPQAATGDELPARADEPTIQIAAPMLERASPRDESAAKPETPLADAPPVAAASIEEAAPAVAPPEPSGPVEAPPVAETSKMISVQPDDDERRRAEARALKARWMAAHDLEALIDTSRAGSDAGRALVVEAAVPAAAPTVRETGSGEAPDPSAHDPQAAAGDLARAPDVKFADAASRGDSPRDKSAAPERAAPLEVAANVEEVASESAAAVRVPATPAPVVDRDVGREASALDLAALDEIAGRREPILDAPIAQATPEMPDAAREPAIAAQDEAADDPRALPGASAAPEAATHRDAADEGLAIAALDEVAGRREPTFDKPVQREPVRRKGWEIAPPMPADRDAASRMREIETRMEAAARSRFDGPIARAASDVALQDAQAAVKSFQLSIAALDEAVGRKEPTFDEPARPADTKPAAAQTAAPRIALRPIETRIEARRVDTLRADPQLSARRPIFPHIEPDEWDMPPVVAAQTRRERRGTGWAIGLGSVLLIAGITAPAAIWQQGRQVQDQVALVNSVSPAPQVQAPAPTATTTAQAPAEATLPAAPQPESPPPAPSVAAQEPDAPSPAKQTPEADQAAVNPKPATTLGTISDGGAVEKAPVVAPPPPMVNLASKAGSAGTGTPMVARPFVPEQGDGPFLRAPTTGATSVPVAGAPVQSATVGVKPNLMGQLKPKATAMVSAAKPVASKPRPATRKPKPFLQQSPDQMFQTLIDTLSEGKPVNPATKPAAPSNRR